MASLRMAFSFSAQFSVVNFKTKTILVVVMMTVLAEIVTVVVEIMMMVIEDVFQN